MTRLPLSVPWFPSDAALGRHTRKTHESGFVIFLVFVQECETEYLPREFDVDDTATSLRLGPCEFFRSAQEHDFSAANVHMVRLSAGFACWFTNGTKISNLNSQAIKLFNLKFF